MSYPFNFSLKGVHLILAPLAKVGKHYCACDHYQ